MNRKRFFESAPDRHLRLMIGAHLLWLVLVFLLGAWWGRLVLGQARRIAELEGMVGLATDLTQSQWHRMQRMLYWEGATFFTLLLASTVLLFWLYWRDVKRSKGIQAFFASVSHELRTPLAGIRLQAESISENLSKENDSRENLLLQRLLEDVLRLETQVEKTLELSRIEGGGPVYTQPLQIKPWVERFLRNWTSNQQSVAFHSQVEDLLIDADPVAMHLIFRNVLENSIRHSNKDRISFTIATERSPRGVALVLKDDGAGYAGEKQQLGVLFQKGPTSNGSGVGLYLIKALMKKMGGAVDFAPQPGFGVSLFFREASLPEGGAHG